MFIKTIRGLLSNEAQDVLELDELVSYAKTFKERHEQVSAYILQLQEDTTDDGQVLHLIFTDAQGQPIEKGNGYLGRTFYTKSLSEEISGMLNDPSMQHPIL